MTTLRELANSVGYTESPISMRRVAQKINQSPASLRALCYPGSSRVFYGEDLHIGDVTCSQLWVEISDDGNWKFNVHIHSDASMIGDHYGVGFAFTGIGRGGIIQGHISAGDDANNTIGGYDPWIRDNWLRIAWSSVIFHAHGVGDEGDVGSIIKAVQVALELGAKVAPFIALACA